MTVIPTPKVEAFSGISEGLAGSAPVQVRFALAVETPAKFKSEKVEAG